MRSQIPRMPTPQSSFISGNATFQQLANDNSTATRQLLKGAGACAGAGPGSFGKPLRQEISPTREGIQDEKAHM